MSLSKWVSESQKTLRQWIGDTPLVLRPLFYAGAAVGVGILSGAFYFYINPEAMLYWIDRYTLRSVGLAVKYVAGKKCTFCYAEHGQLRSDKPSLLLVGRFADRKESWIRVCKGLPNDTHIVCVELPGQGNTTIPIFQSEASLYKLADLLAEFACLLNFDVVAPHVVGWSMGGSVAALYAARYPQLVTRLTLIAPLMQCPIETEFWAVEDEPDNLPFLTTDPEQLKALTEKSYYHPDMAPQSLLIYKTQIKHIQTKRDFLAKLYINMKEEITDESSKYDDLLSKIKCPVQVIWGEQDQIVHESGASLLEELICTVVQTSVLPDCGHAVCSEQTETVAHLITDFYNSY